MIQTIANIPCQTTPIFLRVDLNVPLKDNAVIDPTRIEKVIPTILALLEKTDCVVVATHLGRPKKGDLTPSTKILLPYLQRFLPNTPIYFSDSCTGYETPNKGIYLLENIRFYDGEESNDATFAKELLGPCKTYVNDAFSCSHRAHASICAITQFAPSYAGKLLEEELFYLTSIIKNPKKPLTAIVGGSKISTKITVLNNLLSIVDFLVVGGAMANTFLLAQNVSIDKSLAENDYIKLCQDLLEKYSDKIILPIDYKVSESITDQNFNIYKKNDIFSGMILDIGTGTINLIEECLNKSETVLWNGPLGAYEYHPFDEGSIEIGKRLAKLTSQKQITTVLGGGDTLALAQKAHLTESFSYVSPSGGAFLEFIEGKELPGIKALSGI